ncbi:MAG: hypothetical protein CME20_08385 [Gemmatimonadetes bacterium]|nr:hypothetical protein [Gemmatimonadota bacterium]
MLVEFFRLGCRLAQLPVAGCGVGQFLDQLRQGGGFAVECLIARPHLAQLLVERCNIAIEYLDAGAVLRLALG